MMAGFGAGTPLHHRRNGYRVVFVLRMIVVCRDKTEMVCNCIVGVVITISLALQ